MIIGGSKKAVVANIEQSVATKQFNAKVEVGDPELSPREEQTLLQDHLVATTHLNYRFKNVLARSLMRLSTDYLNRHTKIVGAENLRHFKGGAIVTSNHFNPLENTAIRKMVQKVRHRRLYIVSQPTNLKMTGFIGFMMNYDDILPIGHGMNYMGKTFPNLMASKLQQGNFVLIYPEQEMWFNYRKPRPPKRGAYYYAAKLQQPILSCFVTMTTEPKMDNDEFQQVQYTVHILPLIYPDPAKSVAANSEAMMAQDYRQKVAAYEQAYGVKMNPEFQPGDIAGWRG